MGTPVEAQLTLSDNNSNRSRILKEYPKLRWCIFDPSPLQSASKWTSKLNHFVQGHPGLLKAHTNATRYWVPCDFINKLQTTQQTSLWRTFDHSAMTKCKPLSFYINIILISSSVQEVAFEWISSWNAQLWMQWSVDWFWGIKSMHGIGYSPSSARHASLSALSAFPRKIRLLSPTYTTF